jgi:hypothetical protein
VRAASDTGRTNARDQKYEAEAGARRLMCCFVAAAGKHALDKTLF